MRSGHDTNYLMETKYLVRRALVFGILWEALLLIVSFILYSLKHGREPMEPPFNLVATMIQMPGIRISDWLSQQTSNYDAVFSWAFTFLVQFLIWTAFSFAALLWRGNRKRRQSEFKRYDVDEKLDPE